MAMQSKAYGAPLESQSSIDQFPADTYIFVLNFRLFRVPYSSTEQWFITWWSKEIDKTH